MKKDIKFLVNNTIAHRGIFDNKKVPENSIRAFKDALNNGFAIEFDVHLTKDNKVVVFHDDTLERLTNKKGNIKDYTFEEIKKTKLLDTNYFIPSFDEVLDLINGNVPILIELKYDRKDHILEKEVIKRLEKYNGEFAIQSFDPFIVTYFRFFKNDFIRGLLVSSKGNKISERFVRSMILLPICKPDFLSVDKNLYNNKKVLKYKKNKPVLAWTMKSKKDMDKYKDKFDNVISNINEII